MNRILEDCASVRILTETLMSISADLEPPTILASTRKPKSSIQDSIQHNLIANWNDSRYHGPSPFSTEEASAMRGIHFKLAYWFNSVESFRSNHSTIRIDVLIAYKGRVVASVSIHSYSQLWMSPYGYTSTLPADYAEMVWNLISVLLLFGKKCSHLLKFWFALNSCVSWTSVLMVRDSNHINNHYLN